MPTISDAAILSALYDSTNGDTWLPYARKNWLSGGEYHKVSPCNPQTTWVFGQVPLFGHWYGIDCTNDGYGADRVYRIYLMGVNLTGTLPVELGDRVGDRAAMPQLRVLDVRDNALTYPSSAAEWEQFNRATANCGGGEVDAVALGRMQCDGLPPLGCSAFGPRYMLRLANPYECDLCPESLAWPIARLVAVGVAVVSCAAAYVALVVRHPEALRRWVSTLTIFMNHAQTMSIVGSLGLDWPASVRHLLRALSLDVLNVPQASCILGTSGSGGAGPSEVEYAVYHYAVAFCATVLSVLLLLLLAHRVARARGDTARADRIQFTLSVVYGVAL